MTTRDAMWQALVGPSPDGGRDLDLLVIGGGITGAGVARDAARRGLRVGLVEMQDLASGTSSRSSKLVHGGLRYLQQLELGLVFESVSERRVLRRIAPHLVQPLGFLFPVYRNDELRLWKVNAGMWLYDMLALFRAHKMHRTLRPGQVAEREPTLGQEELVGAPLYWDAATDDARLTLETALDAIAHGAAVVPWCRADRFRRDDDGRVVGVEVVDELTGERRAIAAARVANCTGPWTDDTLALGDDSADGQQQPPLLRRTKGVHAVVSHQALPVAHAVVMVHPRDRRVLFAIPWGDRTYLGTTDTDHEGDPNDVAADRADVDYLLEATAAYFPEHPLGAEDIVATWAGVRPLVAPRAAPGTDPGDVDESSVSREHTIQEAGDGVITVAGGKLTTYRRMAQEVVDLVVRGLREQGRLSREALTHPPTDRHPLPGAEGWPTDDPNADPLLALTARAEEAGGGTVSRETAAYLAATYGTRAPAVAARCAEDPDAAAPLVSGRPEIRAQVDWAVQEELAARVVDVLIRRTQLFFRDREQGLGAAEEVAWRMGALLGWDDERRVAEIARFRDEVDRARRWRFSDARSLDGSGDASLKARAAS